MLIPNCRTATTQGAWTCTVDSPPTMDPKRIQTFRCTFDEWIWECKYIQPAWV